MYESIKNLIESGNYELVDILKKINTVWLKSYITEEEMEELEALAREKANPVNSYAPLQEQIDNIYTELDKIKADINSLKNQEVQATEEPQEPAEPVEEYPPYKQPTGAHDAYKTGDKITYNDKKYVCKLDGCVWTPDAYPAGWEEVVESEG